MKKIIYLVIILGIIIITAFFIINRKEVNSPSKENNTIETVSKEITNVKEPPQTKDKAKVEDKKDSLATDNNTTTNIEVPKKQDTFKYDTVEQTALAKKIRADIDAKDFDSFATDLRKVYDNGWQKIKGFEALESELYVYVTDNYYRKGKYNESLRLANIVFNKVFESWRFTYMKIVSLKGLGDLALKKGDYDLADKYAKDILAIEFRPEGVDLHAQVMIAKAKQAQSAGNIKEAKSLLSGLLDYQLSADRKAEVENLLAGLK